MRWGSSVILASALVGACGVEAPSKAEYAEPEIISQTARVQTVWCHVAQEAAIESLLGPQARAAETIGVEGVFVPGCHWTSADGARSIRLGSLAEEDISNRLLTAQKQFDDLQKFYSKYGEPVELSGLGSRASRIGFSDGSGDGAFTIETAERVFEIETDNLDAASSETFVRALSLDAAPP